RFFPWVWAAVLAILLTGLWTLMLVGMKHAPIYWHIMLLVGLLMATIFVYIFFLPYPELKAAVAAQNWPAGAKALGQIRQLIATNLVLGAATTAVAYLGRFFIA
ncbi:MAG: CopD family protein, partial [Rhodoferax sp.]|nr:CopD family protein [Rhodoferax sp.]